MDTEVLERVIGAGGIVKLPRGVFSVDRAIRVPSGTVLEGSGAVISACHSGHVLLVSGSEGVSIRGLVIRGSWVEGEDSAGLGAGIQVEKSADVLIDGVQILRMAGRGVVASSEVERLRIRDCFIDKCAISVFLFKGVRRSRVESCGIFNSRIIGIFVDDGTQGDTQATAIPNEQTMITGNIVMWGGTSPRNMGVGVGVSGSIDTVIANNTISSFGNKIRISHGIVLNNGQDGFHQGRRTVVLGNILSDHSGYGLYSMGQESIVESGNVYAGNGLGARRFTEVSPV